MSVSPHVVRAVVVDDIEHARRLLADLISIHCPDVAVVGEAAGVSSGAALIGRLRPDIVFLDIELEDGSGFDLLGRLDSRDFGLIFTTASDAHGIRAVKFSALDYLLKPIDPDELAGAVAKARKPDGRRVSVILDNLGRRPGESRRIALNTADRVHVIDTDDIIRCESQRNYTLFHLVGKRQILVTRTLKEFDEMFDDAGFFRTHHSHLINLKLVKEYVKGDGGFLVMNDGSEVPVAVRRKDDLLALLGV